MEFEARRSIAFIGSECYPFVKTGGLGDVMYALPKALAEMNCDVKVILPRYHCIPSKYQEKMVYRGSFNMDLCADGRSFYVGIMEYVWDGVVYDFIDNDEFFSYGNPYTNLVDDIPKFCYFSKAALAALNYMDWVPDIIHCHDWQASLIPVMLRTQFANTALWDSKTVLTIHNLRFQGVYNIPTLKYWTNLPDDVFNIDVFKTGYEDANMLKAGLAYADIITTVSETYAGEIQTPFYGDGLDEHIRHHSGKLRGIVNGIDVEQWDPANDPKLSTPYDISNVLTQKRGNKKALQEELGLEVSDDKFVSRDITIAIPWNVFTTGTLSVVEPGTVLRARVLADTVVSEDPQPEVKKPTPKPARRPSPRQTPLSRIRLSLTGKPEATISLADTICPAENGMGSRTGRSSAV